MKCFMEVHNAHNTTENVNNECKFLLSREDREYEYEFYKAFDSNKKNNHTTIHILPCYSVPAGSL